MGWGMAAMALAGLLAGEEKRKAESKKATKRQKLEAKLAKYSPWTGRQSQVIEQPNRWDAPLQGMMGGAQMGQQIDAANTAEAQYDENQKYQRGREKKWDEYWLNQPQQNQPPR